MIAIVCRCSHHALQHRASPLGPHRGKCSHLACGCDYYRPNLGTTPPAAREAA